MLLPTHRSAPADWDRAVAGHHRRGSTWSGTAAKRWMLEPMVTARVRPAVRGAARAIRRRGAPGAARFPANARMAVAGASC
jgi:hypothetical protein